MGEPNGPGSDLYGPLLDRFTEIVGEAAAKATFHYAALQEGLRIGASEPSLEAALRRADLILGQTTRVLAKESHRVRVAVTDSRLLGLASPVRQAVALGMLEGVLRARMGRAFEATSVGPGPEVSIEFSASQ